MHEHRDLRHLCDEGRAGDNAGILLRGANREDVERGQVLAAPGTTRASIELRKPIAMEVGRRFALREGNKTVDAGKVLTVHA